MPESIEALFLEASEAHRQGRLGVADSLYRAVLEAAPGHAGALYRRGAVALTGSRLEDAETCFRAAVEADPGLVAAWSGIGRVLATAGRLEAAAEALTTATRLDAGLGPAHGDLAVILRRLGRLTEAAKVGRRAAALMPTAAPAWSNLGVILRLIGDRDGAEAAGRRALGLDIGDTTALNLLGLMNQDAGRPAEAQAVFERVLDLDPTFAEAAYNLGLSLKDRGRGAQARAAFRRALDSRPDLAEARFALAMAELPPLYTSQAEIGERRTAYTAALRTLDTAPPRELARGVGASQPFYLPYQGQDDVELQRAYGAIVCRAMAAAYPEARPAAHAPKAGEPLRVGFVSGYFRHHANWRLPLKGWIEGLADPDIRLFGYHTGALADDQTAHAASLCARFVQGPKSTEQWIAEIAADAPHVLIYPEIGMDPMAARLGALRLAPVQCASWGHPQTTGYPTIDHYLSSAAMEGEDADARYTEHLARLPGLSTAYTALPASRATIGRAELGLREDSVVYWCGQSLQKFLPQHDALFARIAARVGDCQFAFIGFPGSPDLTALFQARLKPAFANAGLDAERHIVMLPHLEPDRFSAAQSLADAALDPVGWSGCNSLLEGLAHDLPFVTLPGPSMRGRHGLAILNEMGVDDTLTKDLDGYVEIAARLGFDPAWRRAVRDRIAERKGRLIGQDRWIEPMKMFLHGITDDVASGQGF